MDVWVEFKNASRWQAEALFRNFFPCEEDEEIERQELESVRLDDNMEIEELVRADEPKESKPSRVYKPVDPLKTTLQDESIPPNASSSSSPSSSSAASSTLWSLATSATSLLNSASSTSPPPPLPKTYSGSPIPSSPTESSNPLSSKLDRSQFGASNTAYLPPPPDASITAKSKTKPLDRKTLAVLAKKFADVVPEEEFSVAGLQGCEFIFFKWFLFFLGTFIN